MKSKLLWALAAEVVGAATLGGPAYATTQQGVTTTPLTNKNAFGLARSSPDVPAR